jgi:hypothetical protein
MLHADRLAARLPRARVKAAPISGWFPFHVNKVWCCVRATRSQQGVGVVYVHAVRRTARSARSVGAPGADATRFQTARSRGARMRRG